MGALKSFGFTDIYIGERVSFLSGVQGESDPVPTPAEASEDVAELRAKCKAIFTKEKKPEFAVRHDDTAYRAAILESISETVFVLRRFANEVPDFTKLGFSQSYQKRLLAPRISGLIMVAGAFGQGKTTTASSLLLTRLADHGGVGITIEDPPEMPLEGVQGDGVCFQTWVQQGGFGQACRSAARWAPSIIFLGEVRDSESAVEALRASVNGRLVICTFHANNVIGAMERLYSMAVSELGNQDDVVSLMAHGLYAVVHQRLERGDGDARNLRYEALFAKEPGFEGVSGTIRGRRFEQLGSDIMRQSNLMLTEASRLGGGR